MARLWMILGALAGAGAVGMAAAAAHALSSRLDPKALEAMRSAVQMQGWHALALVLTALWMLRAPPAAFGLANLAGAAFALGMLLFCGAVYANHLGGMRLGPVAPVGGILLMAGWVLLAISAFAAGPTP